MIFDSTNCLISENVVFASEDDTTTEYMLDYAGNTTNTIIYLNGTNITESSAEFDEAERISSFRSVVSTDEQRITNNYHFAYNPISGLTSQMTNETSGIFVEYEFDIMNQLKSLVWKDGSGSVIKSFDYSYSLSGMITNIAREASSEDISYTYNNQGELATSTNGYYTAEYYRDAVGNPTQSIISGFGNPIDMTLGEGNRLSSWSLGGSYSYNTAGCVTSKTAFASHPTAINWNDRYQVTSVSINAALAKSYTYDALGRRSSITDASGNVTKIIYDGMHMVADVDENNALVHTYIAGPGIDNWLSFTDHETTNTYYYITDHLGTVHAVTDSAGNVVESYLYSPFGKVLAIFDENDNILAESAIGNRILFQGREYDWDTGFYYFRARWYDPDTGHWLSKDPIGINGGLNQYVFCGNNPVMFVDPLGLCEDRYAERSQYIQDTRDYINQSWPKGTHWFAGLFLDMFDIGTSTALEAERSGLSPEISWTLGSVEGIAWGVTFEGLLDASIYTSLDAAGKLIDDMMHGREYTVGKDGTRIAPGGNRTGHTTGERPHYHRRVRGKGGNVKRGQGIDRHRPWDTSPEDKTFRERF